MAKTIFNKAVLDAFSPEAFQKRIPYPWHDFENFLTPEMFSQLHNEFPSLDLFEYHQDIYRHGQRPHNRYYLALDESRYGEESKAVKLEDLPQSWQELITELNGPVYRNFIENALGQTNYHLRFCWHVGKSSNEVSPHRDNNDKVGTHIFYLNTSDDWDPSWGGQLLVLGHMLVPGNTPNFNDFATATPIKTMDNHSFLFKNTLNAWHGVKPLNCPKGKYRKLFNVIFEGETE